MKNIYIEMPHELTSYEFYNTVLPQFCNFKSGNTDIIFDFTNTYKVEPLAIPNLLCLGCILKRTYNCTAILDIPDIAHLGKLKRYLFNIGFTRYVTKYDIYKFRYSVYGGHEGKNIDPLCTTLYFGTESSKDEISRGVYQYVDPFANEYLGDFCSAREYDACLYYANDITDFIEEMVDNCKKHAHSFSFTTMHAKRSTQTIYLAVSDIGCGFLATVDTSKKLKNEYDAIMHGVYKRQNDKKYGLFNIIKRVLECQGKVRVHSNDTQIIFTPRIYNEFLCGEFEADNSFFKYNVKTGRRFDGVHIEIELPLERGNI